MVRKITSSTHPPCITPCNKEYDASDGPGRSAKSYHEFVAYYELSKCLYCWGISVGCVVDEAESFQSSMYKIINHLRFEWVKYDMDCELLKSSSDPLHVYLGFPDESISDMVYSYYKKAYFRYLHKRENHAF